MNVYERCPILENERFVMRLVEPRDCDDLLQVYSDENAVDLFNSDNCNGEDFHYQTHERMAQAIDFWLFSYRQRYFVRWSIIDRSTQRAVGTVELFRREAQDAFTNTALLWLDLRSDYERKDEMISILSILRDAVCRLFACQSITTKAVPQARERRAALHELGFEESAEWLTGHDGTKYGHYFVSHPHA